MLHIRSYVVMNRLTVVLECTAHWPATPVRLWFGSRDLDTGTTDEVMAALVSAALSARVALNAGGWSHDCRGGPSEG